MPYIIRLAIYKESNQSSLPAGNRTRPVALVRGRRFDSQPEGLGVAFFATGSGLGLIMYILTTLEFLHTTLTFIY